MQDKKNDTIALSAVYEYYKEGFWLSVHPNAEYNDFVKHILMKEKNGYINHILAKEFNIINSRSFFTESVWSDNKVYVNLKMEFSSFLRNKQIDPSLSLMSLNLFNEMICDKLIELIGKKDKRSDKYGNNISLIKDNFPHAEFGFSEINVSRNERTYAHINDKYGNPRLKITHREYQNLLSKCNLSKIFSEICNYIF